MEVRQKKIYSLKSSRHSLRWKLRKQQTILYFHTNKKLKRQILANGLCGTVNIGALGAEACLRLHYK